MKSIEPETGRARIPKSNHDPTEAEIQKLAAELGIKLSDSFRPRMAHAFFGLGHSQVAEKVKRGEIEPPIPLTETGTAVAWTGRQLVIHHWRRLQTATKRKQQTIAA